MVVLTKKNICFLLLLAVSLFVTEETIMAAGHTAENSTSATTSAHVYVEVHRVKQLIDELGAYMGVPEPEPLGITVTNATPHDVFFQARALAIKTNRLSFELIRKSNEPPVLLGTKIEPTDVRKVVLDVLRVMTEISSEFNLLKVYPMLELKEGITPSDVFVVIMTANRYLNSLMERRFSPGEVYNVVNMAIDYSAHLLAQYPGVERIPKKPLYEKNKRPLDVYYRLYSCLLRIMEIYQVEGFAALEVDISGIEEKNISPSDVFDMASLVVARLDFLNRAKNIRRPIREIYYPGRKVPSDVYQQVGILEQQLSSLLSSLEKEQQANR